jgi:hypothetical protein
MTLNGINQIIVVQNLFVTLYLFVYLVEIFREICSGFDDANRKLCQTFSEDGSLDLPFKSLSIKFAGPTETLNLTWHLKFAGQTFQL